MTFNFFSFLKRLKSFFTPPCHQTSFTNSFFLTYGLKIISSVFASSFNPSIILVKNLRRFPFFGFHEVEGSTGRLNNAAPAFSSIFYLIFCAPWKIRQTAQVINTHGTAWNQFCALNTKALFSHFPRPFFVALPYSWDQGFPKYCVKWLFPNDVQSRMKGIEPCTIHE